MQLTQRSLPESPGDETRKQEVQKNLVQSNENPVISALLSRIQDRSKFDEDSRIPFFHPVVLSFSNIHDDNSGALIRDVSKAGLGLIHRLPITENQVTMETLLSDGVRLEIVLDVAWCLDRGQDWYTSGGRIVRRRLTASNGGVASPMLSLWFGGPKKAMVDSTPLLTHALNEDAERRAHGRKIFLEPVDMTLSTGTKALSVFTREISRSGIGLIHDQPIKPQDVVIAIPFDGNTARVPVNIMWCRSIGSGWFTSGGRFIT